MNESDGLPGSASSPAGVLTAVNELATASEQATVVRLALSSGLLARCGEPIAEAELARALSAPRTAVTAICDVLVSMGALSRVAGKVQLTSTWAPLTDNGLDTALESALDGAAVRRRLIGETFSNAESYWNVGAGERRALAEAVTLPTTTEFGRGAVATAVAGIPELEQALSSGPRWLELGCGVAGMLLGLVHDHPAMNAVGVDVAADLLDLATGRARELGVADRVDFVQADAVHYTDSTPADIVFWSQFFFPDDTREAALANAFGLLRPGGIFLCPVLPGDTESPESGSQTAQQAALNALIFGGWNIPIRKGDELVDEVAAAGFTEIQVHRENLPIVLMARRP